MLTGSEEDISIILAMRCLEWVIGSEGYLDLGDSIAFALGLSRVKAWPSLSLALDCPACSGQVAAEGRGKKSGSQDIGGHGGVA